MIGKIGAAFIPRPTRIEGAIVGQDLKGDHLELMKDIDKNMEDLIIKVFP